MAPPPPSAIDGTELDAAQRTFLERLIKIIWSAGPTRRAEAILDQASRSWRLLFQVVDGRWVRRVVVTLGGEDGSGAILRIPSALPRGEA